MKLLTHNMLTSHVKGVTKGYPLLIKVTAKLTVANLSTDGTMTSEKCCLYFTGSVGVWKHVFLLPYEVFTSLSY